MDPIWGQLLLQVVLIAINAFFASTEIAVISLNANKLKRQAEEGDRKAAQMMKMVEKPEGFLSAIQIGITLAGFLGSAFAADNFAARMSRWMIEEQGVTMSPSALNAICVILVTLILSYFTLVFGELVPKRVAMQQPEKVARSSAAIVYALSIIMKPIIWLLSASTNAVLRIMRIDPNAKEDEVTEEEIRLMVDIGEEKGTILADEREMIENVFEFNNQTAKEVMTHRIDVTAIPLDDPFKDIVETIASSGLSRIPVYEESVDEIIGVLNAKDFLLNAQRKNPKPLMQLLRPPYCVPESVHTDVLFRNMQRMKTHFAVVVDEYGGTSGIVTMEDLIEELVGDIYDETDPLEEQDIVRMGENLWRVAGDVPIDTLADALSTTIPEDEKYDTLGGLVFSKLSEIPEDGATPVVTADGLRIQVEKVEDRRVEWAFVSKVPPDFPTLEEGGSEDDSADGDEDAKSDAGDAAPGGTDSADTTEDDKKEQKDKK